MTKKAGIIFAGTLLVWIFFYVMYPQNPLTVPEAVVVAAIIALLVWGAGFVKKEKKK